MSKEEIDSEKEPELDVWLEHEAGEIYLYVQREGGRPFHVLRLTEEGKCLISAHVDESTGLKLNKGRIKVIKESA